MNYLVKLLRPDRTSAKSTVILTIIMILFGFISLSFASLSETYVSNHKYSKYDFFLYQKIVFSNTDYADINLVHTLNQEIDNVQFYPRFLRYAQGASDIGEFSCALYGTDPTDGVDHIFIASSGERFQDTIPYGQCLISSIIASAHNYSKGDYILLDSVIPFLIKIYEIVNVDAEELIEQIPFILLDLTFLQTSLQLPNKINAIVGSIQDVSEVYDLLLLDNTNRRLNTYDTEIYMYVGDSFTIVHPFIGSLELAQSNLIVLNILFNVIQFFTIVLAIVVVNGLLSHIFMDFPEIKERLQRIGVSKQQIMALQLFKIMILLVPSILIGWIGALAIHGSLYWTTFFSDISLYAKMTLLLVMFAIIRGFAMHQSESYQIVKVQDKKPVWAIIGVFIIGCVGYIFLTFPSLFTIYTLSTVLFIFNTNMILILTGVILVSIILAPFVQQMIGKICVQFKSLFYFGKTYGKRSADHTLVVLLIAFFFILFLHSSSQLLIRNATNEIALKYGGDLNIQNTSRFGMNLSTSEIDAIKDANSNGSTSFIQYSSAQNDFNGNSQFDRVPATLRAGTDGWIRVNAIDLAGIDDEYHAVIDQTLILWENKLDANPLLKITQNTSLCIISANLASNLKIDCGEWVKITIDEIHMTRMQVIGICTSLPALSIFDPTWTSPSIVVDHRVYQNITHDTHYDRLLLRTNTNEKAFIKSIITPICLNASLLLIDTDLMREYLENTQLFQTYQHISLFSYIFIGMIVVIVFPSMFQSRKSEQTILCNAGSSQKLYYMMFIFEIVVNIGVAFVGSYLMHILYTPYLLNQIRSFFYINLIPSDSFI